MTSCDDDVDRSNLSPAYGLHLHDPRLLEYVGAPESARLLINRSKTMSTALQLQHDAGLILSNLQVLGSVFFSPRGEKRGVVGICVLCSYITTRPDY